MHVAGTRLRAKFRHRTTRRLGRDIGPRQNKQTLKYLVDYYLHE